MTSPTGGPPPASSLVPPDDGVADAASHPEDIVAFVAQMEARRAREAPVWGDLGAAMRLKQALVRRVGLSAAFRELQGTLAVPGTDRLAVVHATAMHEAVSGDARYRELWTGGEPFWHDPPPIVGDHDSLPISGIDRALYVGVVDDAVVRGRSSLIRHGDSILVDVEPRERGLLRDNLEHDPGVLWAEEGQVWSMEPWTVGVEIDGGVMLSGARSDDGWQWLTEYLPKLALAWMADVDPNLPILVDARIPVRHVEALRLLAPGARLVSVPHQSPIRVRHLHCVSSPALAGVFPLEMTPSAWAARSGNAWRRAVLLRVLKERVVGSLDGSVTNERLYLAPMPQHRKTLLDHERIEAAVRRLGFLVVRPEEHSFAELLGMVHHARWIIAPEGPQVATALFARPGSQLLILSSPTTFPLTDICAVFAALGVSARILTGPISGDRPDWAFWADYSIDATLLVSTVDAWSR